MTLLKRNLHKLAIILGATLSLASCGGGGGDSSSAPTTTVTGLSRAGIVAGVSQPLYIYGTNFSIGMTLHITSSDPAVDISPNSITAGTITINNFSISAAPTERYVTINVMSGTITVGSIDLGVASTNKTLAADIQTIFDNNLCYSCHGASGGLNLSTAQLSTTGLIETSSTRCSSKLRVKAGDPRRENNVLLDVLHAKTGTAVMSCNTSISTPDRRMPQGTNPALSQSEIDAIIEWIAGGAH